MNKHLAGTMQQLEQSIVHVPSVSLPVPTWQIYKSASKRKNGCSFILNLFISHRKKRMNASKDAVIGHLIPLRLVYLRDKEGILLPPDKCEGQLFIVQSESPTCFQHTKQRSVPGRRSDYTYSSYLMVLELWLIENKMALSCKPVRVVMCPEQFMLFMLLGKSCNQKWLRLVPDDRSGFRNPKTPLLHGGVGDAFREDVVGEIG